MACPGAAECGVRPQAPSQNRLGPVSGVVSDCGCTSGGLPGADSRRRIRAEQPLNDRPAPRLSRREGDRMERDHSTRRQFLAAAGAAGVTALGMTTSLRAARESGYEKTVLSRGPVAYSRLGEKEGPNALDSTRNGHK